MDAVPGFGGTEKLHFPAHHLPPAGIDWREGGIAMNSFDPVCAENVWSRVQGCAAPQQAAAPAAPADLPALITRARAACASAQRLKPCLRGQAAACMEEQARQLKLQVRWLKALCFAQNGMCDCAPSEPACSCGPSEALRAHYQMLLELSEQYRCSALPDCRQLRALAPQTMEMACRTLEILAHCLP